MGECIGADRLLVMSQGQVILDGSPKEIFPQVETMEEAHLGVPDTTRLLYALDREGYRLPLEAISTEECAQALFAAFKE
jgi:energy-coupling factor transport system ATP-binding protein